MIYFGIMPPSGTAEIFYEMFVNRNKKFLNGCKLSLNDQWPYYKRVPYVEEIEIKYQCNFRCVNWEDDLDYFDDICNRYAPSQDIWFATYSDLTFTAISEHRNCKTVSINYNEESYNFVRHLWANWQTGNILNKQLSTEEPRKIYQRCLDQGPEAFGYSIPYTKYHDADININLEDLYKQSTIEKILVELDCNNTLEDWSFYQTYVDAVCKFG